MCVSVRHPGAVLADARRRHWIPWNRRYRWLLVTVWVLQFEPGSFGMAGPPESHPGPYTMTFEAIHF